MNWHKGDMAIFVSVMGDARNPELYGQVCELLSFEGKPDLGTADSVWLVQFSTKSILVATACLRQIPDDKHKLFHAQLIPAEPDYQWNKEVVYVDK